MRLLLLLYFMQAALLGASFAPKSPVLTVRALADCNDGTVQVITGILKQYPATASQICSQVLDRGPSPKTTTTITITSTVRSTVTSGTVTSTATVGLATATTTLTITSQTGTVITSINTSTQTSITTSTVATSIATTFATVTTAVTSTQTSYSARLSPQPNTPAKRQANEETLGQKYPGCPKALSSIVLSIATKACNCFLPSATTSALTVTATATTTSTITNTATNTITVPSGTTTLTRTETSFRNVDSTTIITTTSTITSTSSVTAISTVMSTSTVTSTAVTSTTVPVSFTKKQEKVGSPSCAYNNYYRSVTSISNVESQGVQQCAAACAADARCRFFYYDRYNDNVGGLGECDLSERAYDSAQVQCNLPTRYGVGYEKT